MRVRRSLAPLLALAALSLALAPAAAADDGGRPFRLVLTGAAERPGPGDPDGTGTAILRVNPGQREVCYHWEVSGISTIVGAHIHRAPVTDAGPVVIPTPVTTATSGTGCASADRELLIEIIQHPEEFYLNVHSDQYPAGALRSQLG